MVTEASDAVRSHGRPGTDPANRARVRRERDRTALPAAGRGPGISARHHETSRGNGDARHPLPSGIRRLRIDLLRLRLIIEELARVDGSIGLSVAAHNSLCSNHIYLAGTEEQKRRFLVPLAQGKKIGAWSLTEPTAGSDASGTKSTARKEGPFWVLNGSKTFATHGSVCD